MKKKKSKRKNYAPGMDAHTKEVIENAIRIRTRMRVRDCAGNERLFRSTVAENPEGTEDEAEESG